MEQGAGAAREPEGVSGDEDRAEAEVTWMPPASVTPRELVKSVYFRPHPRFRGLSLVPRWF